MKEGRDGGREEGGMEAGREEGREGRNFEMKIKDKQEENGIKIKRLFSS